MKKLLGILVMLLALVLCAGALADMPAVEGSMPLSYAKNFSVDYLEGGYQLITIRKGDTVVHRFLTIPEDAAAPEGLDEDVVTLQLPLHDLLVSSTPATSLINAIGALESVSLTTTDYDTWYIPEVKDEMNTGNIVYVGSYKDPDFELLATVRPPFAVFSTMLESVPDVAEKLGELGIPYMLDESTYEDHPLGRVEWIKLYGALLGREADAEDAFDAQEALIASIEGAQTGKTVAMFYITSKGALYVRNGGDYMAAMLRLAGGDYVLSSLNPEKSGTQQIEMEEFFVQASQADYIIYIWSLGGKPATLADFIARNELLADFKAVKAGNVWCTTPDYFQISNTLGEMVSDMNRMLTCTDPDVDAFTYLFRLK